MNDRGAVISLPYGLEGFATPKHLVKEDGTQAQPEEKLAFKVIEFNKEAKRIILSHSRIFEDEQKTKRQEAAAEARANQANNNANFTQTAVEKSTLGDLDVLAELREKLEGAE